MTDRGHVVEVAENLRALYHVRGGVQVDAARCALVVRRREVGEGADDVGRGARDDPAVLVEVVAFGRGTVPVGRRVKDVLEADAVCVNERPLHVDEVAPERFVV